jgi:hypothetical protein
MNQRRIEYPGFAFQMLKQVKLDIAKPEKAFKGR